MEGEKVSMKKNQFKIIFLTDFTPKLIQIKINLKYLRDLSLFRYFISLLRVIHPNNHSLGFST